MRPAKGFDVSRVACSLHLTALCFINHNRAAVESRTWAGTSAKMIDDSELIKKFF